MFIPPSATEMSTEMSFRVVVTAEHTTLSKFAMVKKTEAWPKAPQRPNFAIFAMSRGSRRQKRQPSWSSERAAKHREANASGSQHQHLSANLHLRSLHRRRHVDVAPEHEVLGVLPTALGTWAQA